MLREFGQQIPQPELPCVPNLKSEQLLSEGDGQCSPLFLEVPLNKIVEFIVCYRAKLMRCIDNSTLVFLSRCSAGNLSRN